MKIGGSRDICCKSIRRQRLGVKDSLRSPINNQKITLTEFALLLLFSYVAFFYSEKSSNRISDLLVKQNEKVELSEDAYVNLLGSPKPSGRFLIFSQ